MLTTRYGMILATVAAVLAPLAAAQAAPYSALYVFGDSLSDRGNLAETGVLQRAASPGAPVGNYPDPPFFHDSFTNGPVSVSLLASDLGLAAEPSLWVTGFRDVNNLFGGATYVPGTNYAVAGATSQAQAAGGPPGINLPQQIAAYFSITPVADPNALYTVFIGGNDVRNAAKQDAGASNTAAGRASISAAVTTEIGAVQALVGAGARNLLVINVPDVGAIPEFAQQAPSQAPAATFYTQLYNRQLAAGLSGVALAGATLTQFDLQSFNTEIGTNPGRYGFTNATDPCYLATGALSAASSAACGPGASNIDLLVYWDSIHPTAGVHALWAQGEAAALATSLSTAVPEPAALALLVAGLGMLVAVRATRDQPRRARAPRPVGHH